MCASWKLGLVLCLALALGIKAELSSQELVSELPDCGMNCIMNLTAESPCAPTNKTCTCHNQQLQNVIIACVTKACTVKEALVTKNLTATYCDIPVTDLAVGHVLMSNTIGVIGDLFLAQRLIFKLWWRVPFSLDDWALIAVAVLGIPGLTLDQYGLIGNGLGRDIWTVPFEMITKFGIFFYALVIIYFTQIMFLKLAVLLFYWRIFTSPGIRKIILATMVASGVWGFAFIFLCVFQCTPIWYFWHQWEGEYQGTCVSIQAIIWTNALTSIALDIWMLFLPLWRLKGMNIPWGKKFGIGLMFSVGALVTVVSVVRLVIFAKYGNTRNHGRDIILVVRWSTIEIYVGMICACMPSIRVAFMRIFAKPRSPPPNAPQNGATTVNMFHFGYFGQGRPAGQFSQVQTVNGGFRLDNAFGILCEKSFTLAIDETDETQLVHAIELDRKSEKSEITSSITDQWASSTTDQWASSIADRWGLEPHGSHAERVGR